MFCLDIVKFPGTSKLKCSLQLALADEVQVVRDESTVQLLSHRTVAISVCYPSISILCSSESVTSAASVVHGSVVDWVMYM